MLEWTPHEILGYSTLSICLIWIMMYRYISISSMGISGSNWWRYVKTYHIKFAHISCVYTPLLFEWLYLYHVTSLKGRQTSHNLRGCNQAAPSNCVRLNTWRCLDHPIPEAIVPWNSAWWLSPLSPLVNVNKKTMERSTMFHGKIH